MVRAMTLNFEYILQKYREITLLKRLLKREIRELADFLPTNFLGQSKKGYSRFEN